MKSLGQKRNASTWNGGFPEIVLIKGLVDFVARPGVDIISVPNRPLHLSTYACSRFPNAR